MRTTQLIIDIKKIKTNIYNIKQFIGNDVEMMPIIKCNAYGSHLNKFNEIINEFKYVGVAFIDEGIALRNTGYKGKILILYPPMKEDLNIIQEYDLYFNGCDIKVLEYFNKKTSRPLTVHIEIETGMGRTGVQIKNIDSFLERLRVLQNISIDGIYSHLSSSSSDIEYSKLQIEKFKTVLEKFKYENITYNYAHISNSGALFTFKDKLFNMVRVGLLIYGYFPNERFRNILNLYPSMVLKTKISFIIELDVNDSVGYNKTFITKRKSLIATIPFGFGDGFIGLETGEAYVIIKNTKAKIVGICMDNMLIDITDIPNVKTGDDVIIFDNKQLTVEEIAYWCNKISNYEIITSLSDRIPRIFI
jgi:alanine racemase